MIILFPSQTAKLPFSRDHWKPSHLRGTFIISCMLGTKGSVRNGGWWDTQADERAQVASMGVANGQGAQQDNAQHNFNFFVFLKLFCCQIPIPDGAD